MSVPGAVPSRWPAIACVAAATLYGIAFLGAESQIAVGALLALAAAAILLGARTGALDKVRDSIGANIAEGFGRGTTNDQRHFLRIARGSLNETTHFLRRLYRRKLLNDKQISTLRPIMDALGPKLNAYLSSVSRRVSALPKKSSRRQTGTTNHKPHTTNN